MRLIQLATSLLCIVFIQANCQEMPVSNQAAHWLDLNSILIQKHPQAKTVELVVSNTRASEGQSSASYALLPRAMDTEISTHFLHLINFNKFHIEMTDAQARKAVKKPLLVVQKDVNGRPLVYSKVQTSALLDELFASNVLPTQQLGAYINKQKVEFSLWAPTALKVSIQLFDENKRRLSDSPLQMQENPATGIWQAQIKNTQGEIYYQYQIQVYHHQSDRVETLVTTDPYSLSLSINSQHSHVIDLDTPQTKPKGWDQHSAPPLAKPEDQILYEVHIRDFSANDARLSDQTNKGKYGAFLEQDSLGIAHLKALKQAGLNTIHLLPTYDIATVNEDPDKRIALDDKLSKICRIKSDFSACQQNNKNQRLVDLLKQYAPTSDQQQALITEIRQLDDYNWGYDPYHYTVPEGSYAKQPEGAARIIEFRQMVQRLHQMGFRVVMDVVYNHTYAAGLAEKSVLDKVVPGYYHRRHPISGEVEQSTCCDNTATERKMMAKLMTDSLVVWAQEYKIDGFRFDLMGHQPKAAMLAAREAVRQVDADTYFYGEGWNFGEVANNSQFVQASQLELAGTEIGTFTDRLRDAVRGGASFSSGDDYRRAQGLGNGLLTMPNELQPDDQQKQHYLLLADQARVGLTGNLANFPLLNFQDVQITGKQVNYNGSPTGYALDPADTINYVSKHDNQTLWDNNQYRIANAATPEQRVRMQLLSLAFPMYSQGIPFIHMGSELLRSKGFLRDSYDYGDWFNAVDFSAQSNNYNTGLPPAEKDQQNWALIEKLKNNNAGRDQATPEMIANARDSFVDMLAVRASSPLFRLREAEKIEKSIRFLNTGSQQQAGLILMQIDDTFDLDKNWNGLLVAFNLSASTQNIEINEQQGYRLHPVLQQGHDKQQRLAIYQKGSLTLPALTASVFVHD